MFHLSLRVAWHDSRWNGAVCRSPAGNAFCASLDRIRQEKQPEAEEALGGRCFSTLKPQELPPCKAESGAFMNEKEWTRVFEHPYEDIASDRIIWEHLGMMSREDYRLSWEGRRKDYEAAGYKAGVNLFTSEDDDRGGLDSAEIRKLATRIKELI